MMKNFDIRSIDIHSIIATLKSFFVSLCLLLALFIGIFLGFRAYLHATVKESVDLQLQKLWPVAVLSYSDIITALDGRITLTGVKIRPYDVDEELTLRKVVVATPGLRFLMNIDQYAPQKNVPSLLSLTFEGLEINTKGPLMTLIKAAAHHKEQSASGCAADSNKLLTLSRLGYDKLVMNGQLGYEYNTTTSQLRTHFSVENIDIDRSDIEAVWRTPNLNQALRGEWSSVEFINGSFDYKDHHFQGRFNSYCAQQAGISVNEFINRKVAKEASSLLPRLALGPQLQQGYRALLSADGELSLTAQPVAPIPMAKFQSNNPSQWLKLVNLNVSINGRAINNVDLQYRPAPAQQFSQRLLATLPSLRSYADELTGQPIQVATPPPQNRPSETPPVKLAYSPINLNEIANHIGTSIRIKTREGLTREGRLTEVTAEEVVISWLLPRGEVTAFVTFDEIDSVEIPQKQPAIQQQ